MMWSSRCRELLPSLPTERFLEGTRAEPMEKVSADLFALQGRDYLVMVDRASGYPFVGPLRKTSTVDVWKLLETWFLENGYPRCLQTDNGPQFRGQFSALCEQHGVRHVLSSPYNPQSNGLAESAVKSMKYLLQKCLASGEDFAPALLQWRNTPRASGVSPASLFFGRRQRTTLPVLQHTLAVDAAAASDKRHAAMDEEVARSAERPSLPPLGVGTMWLCNALTHGGGGNLLRWCLCGTRGDPTFFALRRGRLSRGIVASSGPVR